MPDEPHVKVTLSTIYDIQQEHGEILVEIKEALKQLPDHEKRIRNLEWMNRGAFVALIAFGVEWLNRITG